MLQYGNALFSDKCPHCNGITEPCGSLSVNKFMNDTINKKTRTAPAKCGGCGNVRVKFVGFE